MRASTATRLNRSTLPADAALRAISAQLSEREWQEQIVRLARSLGWTVYHTYDSRRSASGFPDLVLLKPPRALFWELKTERGKLQPAQEHMLEMLTACGLSAAVVRPGDREWVHRQLMGED
jgi:hypothetical protein